MAAKQNHTDLSVILGTGGDRRHTQDSPIWLNVWQQFIERPGAPLRLLLTPHRDHRPGELAAGLSALRDKVQPSNNPRFPYSQSTVATELTFEQVVTWLLPLSAWWRKDILPAYRSSKLKADSLTADQLAYLRGDPLPRGSKLAPDTFLWWIRATGTLGSPAKRRDRLTAERVLECGLDLLRLSIKLAGHDSGPLLYSVALNRQAEMSTAQSVSSIKADAAYRVFGIQCRNISWAVLDSGIDRDHPAFDDPDPPAPRQLKKSKRTPEKVQEPRRSRVVETYDFTRLEDLLSLASSPDTRDHDELRAEFGLALGDARELIMAVREGRDLDWASVAPALRVAGGDSSYVADLHSHGTHVAGILGAAKVVEDDGTEHSPGVCPDIKLYDIRVLDGDGRGSEFAIIAALQFVRFLNAHKDQPIIHGVNLSLSIEHDVRTYACGQTPVCEESERLSASGVVVVAAAGNAGWEEGGGYRDISIADPGNAESVITVGATHRGLPHTYGVSYFSSRGPTGDGRAKPDLVAPGEKITAPVPNRGYETKDGTSMAAPHVSGAAAMLMARHKELAGRPAEIKKILCDSATDLGRIRDFQGRGLLDILRALQSH